MSCFVCYRRIEGASAGRLHEYLRRRVGARAVFMDQSNLHPGEEYPARLDAAVRAADDLLVVIGPTWAEPRLGDPKDYVRREILGARAARRHIIPVLVSGATMPPEAQLPEELRFLVLIHAAVLRAETWDDDCDRLWRQLRSRVKSMRYSAIAITVTLATLGGGTVAAVRLWPDPPPPPPPQKRTDFKPRLKGLQYDNGVIAKPGIDTTVKPAKALHFKRDGGAAPAHEPERFTMDDSVPAPLKPLLAKAIGAAHPFAACAHLEITAHVNSDNLKLYAGCSCAKVEPLLVARTDPDAAPSTVAATFAAGLERVRGQLDCGP